jgi:hypothetical protein
MTKIPAPSGKVNTKRTQEQKILNLLIAAFKEKREIPLPEMMACAAQYNARVHSLRAQGWNIANRSEYKAGIRHTFFRLTSLFAGAGDSQAVTPSSNRADRRSALRNIDSGNQANLLILPEQTARTWKDPEAGR